MKIFNIILIIIISLLSIAAGAAKVLLTSQEVQFLHGFGLNNTVIIIFGAIQILGGAILAHKNLRMYGAVIVVLGLFISSLLIFFSGNVTFGIISLLPVALTVVIIKQSAKLRITF